MNNDEQIPLWRSAAFDLLDGAFGDLMARLDPGRPCVALAAALVSRGRAAGHVCWTLGSELVLKTEGAEGQEFALPSEKEWRAGLAGSPLVGRPGDFAPLILDEAGRLYLHQLHAVEGKLAEAISRRAAAGSSQLDMKRLETFLGGLMAGNSLNAKQRDAVVTACASPLTILTGGPGTGKTHTAVRMIAAGIILDLVQPERIRLAAPTGKAAARLQEKLDQELGALLGDAARAAAVPKASTLHRLLGASAVGTRFARDQKNPLEADWVLVDEVSMVGMEMMWRLFDATVPAKKVILIGDSNQLESMEVGAVLAELVRAGNAGVVVSLQENLRVETESAGLLALASAVNEGSVDKLLAGLQSGIWPEVKLHSLSGPQRLKELIEETAGQFYRARDAKTPEQALAEYGESKVLCALRHGPSGSLHFNNLVEQKVAHGEKEKVGGYHGRPVMVSKNNYSTGIFNGELGVVWRGENGMAAMFPGEGGQLRSVPLSSLPAHETAFALTVHKGQGSEFDRVHFVLPLEDSPVLSRELIYTAVSRARNALQIWGPEKVLATAVARPGRRHSGLGARLVASRGN
ncbi:MAG: exodeoxyribonuclease V subunit alpha [Pedosphaera sp.]|nr:exodeoxyribonuclease V subunit alpha [Pedosphaera sp.]